LIRRRDFLLDQAADHARLVRGEFDVHDMLPRRPGMF
jgi:hypothetical protein